MFDLDDDNRIAVIEVNARHGGPYDRGGADYWYGRFDPHYWTGRTGDVLNGSVKVALTSGTRGYAEYMLGYYEGSRWGHRKDYSPEPVTEEGYDD